VNDDARRRHDQMRKAAGGKGKPPPKKAPARAVVAHACGHKVGLAQLESQDCAGCVGARRRAHNREKYDRFGMERVGPIALPDGLRVECDKRDGAYHGRMSLPYTTADGQRLWHTLTAQSPTYDKLGHLLGRMAREWLKAREGGGA
jgi:hypothetical protein